ncbi:MAG: hypothetical protein QM692_23740 [Thermomicrobiales bacterium]
MSLTARIVLLAQAIAADVKTLTAAVAAKLDASGNAASAAKLATARTISATGDATWSTSFDGSAAATGTLTLASSGATAGSYGPTAAATLTYGGTFTVPQVTVDAKGRSTAVVARTMTMPAAPTTVTGNAGTATALATARTLSWTGDATGSMSFDGSANVSAALTLASSGATAGTYGATSLTAGTAPVVPYLTVSAKGLVTAAGTNTLGTAASYATGTSGATVPLLSTANTWSAAQTFSGGAVGALTGNATTATTLATARTIQTNLASTSSVSFNGSANVTPGVTG